MLRELEKCIYLSFPIADNSPHEEEKKANNPVATRLQTTKDALNDSKPLLRCVLWCFPVLCALVDGTSIQVHSVLRAVMLVVVAVVAVVAA